MPARHRQTDFNGGAFYLVAVCAACAIGWQDLLVMFFGELLGLKLLLGPIILARVMNLFDRMIDLMHQSLTRRVGAFRAVLITMLAVFIVVRGALAISARAHEGPPAPEQLMDSEEHLSLQTSHNSHW